MGFLSRRGTKSTEARRFARTTFSRHKDAIQDIFGVIIDCDIQQWMQ